MADFIDGFGAVLLKGLDKKVDSEFSQAPTVGDDRNIRTLNSGDGLAVEGNSTQSFIKKNKPMLLIALSAVVAAVVISKVA